MYFQKFRLPPPSSNFLADIIGLKKKQATRDQSKMGEGMAMILVWWFAHSERYYSMLIKWIYRLHLFLQTTKLNFNYLKQKSNFLKKKWVST